MKQHNKILAWICLAVLLGQLVEFSYPAVLQAISKDWVLSSLKAGLLFSAFRVGYIASILFVSALIDSVGARRVMIVCFLIVGFAGSSFALLARGFLSGGFLYLVAGIGSAGIYIPGIKVLSTWFSEAKRGKALGIYVGVIILARSISLVLTGFVASIRGWRMGILTASLAAFVGAIIIFLFIKERQPVFINSSAKITLPNFKLLSNKPLILTIIGYAAHNWELLAMWGWIAPFMIATLSTRGYSNTQSIGTTIAAAIVGIGALASFLGGHISDKMGRTFTVLIMLGISGICSLAFGWLAETPLFLIVLIGLIYGFFIVGDSPIFSTQVTELAPNGKVGAALGLQSFIGFIPAVISPAIFGLILDATNREWGWAFSMLAFGALLGFSAIFLLSRRSITST